MGNRRGIGIDEGGQAGRQGGGLKQEEKERGGQEERQTETGSQKERPAGVLAAGRD